MKNRHKRLGLAFKDEINKVNRPFGHFRGVSGDLAWQDNFLPNFEPEERWEKVSPWRLVALACVFLVVFFGLFIRLFHLQVVQGKENRELADSNRIQIKVIHAPRGVIYDRNGKILAENNPGFRMKEKFISRDEALSLEAKGNQAVDELEVDAIRFYPLGLVTAHILGYVGQISPEELEDPKYAGYRMGDRIGRSGIEQVYEPFLRGTDGAEIVEVDASGKKLRSLRKVDPVPGKNIYLAVDADLQKVVFDSLRSGLEKVGSCCGVVVGVNPKSGEVLVLAASPSYDGNAFTDPKRNEEVEGYFNDPLSPMLNRAISGTYPPGSTFKIATALAGLSSGKVTSQTQIEDTGVMFLGPWSFANWYFTEYGRKEGLVDIIKALQRSNDIFFYRVGEMIGEKILGETAVKIGFGKKIGIDLPGEADGLIPTNAWKEKNIGESWYPGDTLHMAIGQGYVLATPLQILAATSFIADDGNLIQPHLAVKITQPDDINAVVKQFRFEPIVKGIFKQEAIDLVKRGLSTVPKDGGTAWPFFSFSIPTAGKTGTAEFGDSKGRTHAWYTSYAPADNPEIALTVLVEAGGEGSNASAPIAKEVYTWYFNTDKGNIKSLDNFAIASESAKALGE